MKLKSTGFDFRAKIEDDSPCAVCWIKSSMRKDWIRYGNNVSLDAMKRKYSSLHWPYIGPVGLDNEHRIYLF